LADIVGIDIGGGRVGAGQHVNSDLSRHPGSTDIRGAGAGDPSGVTVSASGLSKRFGNRAGVSDPSFSVAQGNAFGVLGPNGSGKTTTVRLLTGLLMPDSGTVRLFGELVNPANADLLRRRIASMSPEFWRRQWAS
jgi:ABC-type multidrug transport system fused ATPase/permease subunit